MSAPLEVDQYGYAVISDHSDGWTGCGYKAQDTRIRMRRVDDVVQIDVCIETFTHGGRLMTRIGSATLTAEQLELLARHLTAKVPA